MCINPKHLEIGTRSQNSFEDRIRDDTINRGENHYSSKITKEVAQQIKLSKFEKNEPEYKTQKERAKFFGVTIGIINNIDTGSNWGHLPDKNGKTSDKRKKTRAIKKKAMKRIWTKKNYEDFIERIKKNIICNNDNKKDHSIPGFCWEWQMYINPKGYGVVCFLGKQVRVHIPACESKYGRRRRKNEHTRHLCGNKICCNPEHLKFGTPSENANDARKHKSNKLQKLEVKDIIDIRNSSETNAALAKKYKISNGHVSDIRNHKSWKGIDQIQSDNGETNLNPVCQINDSILETLDF